MITSIVSSSRKLEARRRMVLGWMIPVILLMFVLVWGAGRLLSTAIPSAFPSDTPTSTITPIQLEPTWTTTPLSNSTEMPTVTPTFTITASPTPDRPFFYIVQEGDSLAAIAEKYNLGDDGIKKIVMLNPYNETTGGGIDPTTQIIYPGLELLLPNPGYQLPTSTPIFLANLPRGTKLNYTVEIGDTLADIAAKFNSTPEEIIKENKITDPNALFVGQELVIPANLVTPAPPP